MSDTTQSGSAARPPRRFVSPGSFLVVAVAIGAIFLVCHLAGWRQNTSFLCGTPPVGRSPELCLALGLLYAMSYFAFVVVAPILVLAAAVFSLLLRLLHRKPNT